MDHQIALALGMRANHCLIQQGPFSPIPYSPFPSYFPMTNIDCKPVTLTPSYSQEDWQKGYVSLKEEFDYWIDEIEGEIPGELNGTLFRNGPGLLDVNGQRLQHPFDGDGMICAIAFKDGRAHFRNRFVRTEGFVAEQQARRILYRGVFGTDKPGGWLANCLDLRFKNIANTNVIYWGNKLLALWEGGAPHHLDSATLETVGLDNLDGRLRSGTAFSAHPWIDPGTTDSERSKNVVSPRLVNFSIKNGFPSQITLFEFAPDGTLVHQYSHSIPGFCFIHDFAITPSYAIFFQNPVTLNPLPYLVGIRTVGECIQFQGDRPTKIILIPRPQDENTPANPPSSTPKIQTPLVLEATAGFVFHHANAFESGDELIIDSVCYESLAAVDPDGDYRETNFDTLPPGQLWRFRVNLQTQTVERQQLGSRSCEFPSRHPAKVGRSHRYLYLAAAHASTGNAPLQAILKTDVISGNQLLWSAAPWGYVGEPVFVPRDVNPYQLAGAEDDGWVMTMVFDAKRERSDVVILDAQNFQLLARLHLKHHVPYGLHGSFTRQSFL
jgi:all-trans-8'-apo-beta-carotenal 15,15'-oxygenase